MEDKKINDVTIRTEQVSLHPLAFKIHATHPNGAVHAVGLTIGDADLKNIATLEDAQKYLDAARENAAVMCQKKAELSAIASQLK